jgi:hypothetical protein
MYFRNGHNQITFSDNILQVNLAGQLVAMNRFPPIIHLTTNTSPGHIIMLGICVLLECKIRSKFFVANLAGYEHNRCSVSFSLQVELLMSYQTMLVCESALTNLADE